MNDCTQQKIQGCPVRRRARSQNAQSLHVQRRACLQEEVDRNFVVFMQKLDGLMQEHSGQYALLKRGRITGYFSSFNDAEKAAKSRYRDRLYSIQKVDDTVVDLGFVGTLLHA